MHRFSNHQLRLLKWEYIVLTIAIIAFLISFIVLAINFYKNNTKLVPSTGGTYIEGSVGELQPLNPWFTVRNDVNRDIVSLVFSGLLRYNPKTQQIEDDLATVEVSNDNRIYTVKLKDDIYWHDSTPENPHPVTPEDVLFTFQTIQNPEFPNTLLRQNYLGIDIEKIDDRTIRFKLDEPYSFFKSNLTLGLLPKKSFDGIPVAKLDQALEFAFNPIGAGPYAFKSFIQTEISSEITLEKFQRPFEEKYHIKRLIFRIFPDYNALLSDIRNLDGIRHVPRNNNGEPIIPRQFKAANYTLPQYVALFLNMERPILTDRNLRLGLQFGTNKNEIIKTIGESLIVDTPLLEIDVLDWRYKYNKKLAQGAFFSSNWHLPEKVRLQRLLEMREANSIGSLKIDPIVLLDTGAILTVTGSFVNVPQGSKVNGQIIQNNPNLSGSWIVSLSTYGGTGALSLGQNLIQMIDPKGNILDSTYVWRTNKPKEYKRAAEEQNLVDIFIASRNNKLPPEKSISVMDLFVEKGMLRRRLTTDPYDIRVNNKGERLSLTLLTSPSPPQYKKIAKLIKEQWEPLGIHISIVIPTSRDEFEKKLLTRDYDILLFGQSLLDNLDSFPYWHSSGIQKLTDNTNDLRLDAYNLSQYSSMEADALLELIRQTSDDKERANALDELREVIKKDVPAIFLYSPIYTYAYTNDLKGVKLDNLSLHSDRFLTLDNWFLKMERVFIPGKSWWSFPRWVISLI